MDFKLTSLSAVLERADGRLRSPDAGVRLWPTGFPPARRRHRRRLPRRHPQPPRRPPGPGQDDVRPPGGPRGGEAGPLRGVLLLRARGRRADPAAGGDGGRRARPLRGTRPERDPEHLRGHRRRHRRPASSGWRPPTASAPRPCSASASTPTAWSCTAPPRPTPTSPRSTTRSRRSWASTGESPLIVVDYLQKVAMPLTELDEEERITRITEQLKDVAIEFDCPGLRRRGHGPRGPRARRPDADPPHARLDGPVLRARRRPDPRHQVRHRRPPPPDVRRRQRRAASRTGRSLTVEKNRSGSGGAEIEFKKRFDQGRFDPNGKVVTEKLVDERVYVE